MPLVHLSCLSETAARWLVPVWVLFVCIAQAFSSPFSFEEKTTATQGSKKILSSTRHYLLLSMHFICLYILLSLLGEGKVFIV